MLEATREGKTDDGADVYRLQLQAGGGTAHGQARLAISKRGHMTLTGELSPRQVEIQALLASFNRTAFIGGLASGETTLRAEGETVGALFRSLRTRSTLQVERAVSDIERAIKAAHPDVSRVFVEAQGFDADRKGGSA